MVASIPARVTNDKGFTLIDLLFVVGDHRACLRRSPSRV